MNPTLDTPSVALRTKRIRAPNRTTLTLTFEDQDTEALRVACIALRPKDGRVPSLSLVARRALTLYREHLQRLRWAHQGSLAEEAAEISRMASPPCDKTKLKMKARQ